MDMHTRNALSLINLWRMGVLWILALLWSHFELFARKISGLERAFPACPPDRHSKLACIVTGASSGIGRATAEALACQGYYVILAGRSLVRLSKVVEEIELRHKGVSVKAMEIDLTSMSSILKFKEDVEELWKEPNAPTSLQLLVNNAGVLAATRRITPEGYDYMIASNYLGHFMLTQLLLPLMQRSSQPARIVITGSFTHRCVRSLQVNVERLTKGGMHIPTKSRRISILYPIACVYEESKLSMVLFAYELHRRLRISGPSSQITVMTADPGIVHTGIFREFPGWLSLLVIASLRFVGLMQSPTAGCKAVVDAALAPPGVSGQYFFGGNGRTMTSSALSYNQETARSLWETSSTLYEAALARHRSTFQNK